MRWRCPVDGSRLDAHRRARIFVADAWGNLGNLAGRMLFGPDATLCVTVGVRGLCCTGTGTTACG